MITFNKIMNAFEDYLEEDHSVEIVKLEHGYFIVSWQPIIQRYDFSRFCITLDELANELCAYYIHYLLYKDIKHFELEEDEIKNEYMEIAKSKIEKCYID